MHMRKRLIVCLATLACSHRAGAPPMAGEPDGAAEELPDALVRAADVADRKSDAPPGPALDARSSQPTPDVAADASASIAADAGPATALGPAGGRCPGGPYGNPLPADHNARLVRAFPGRTLEAPVWVQAQHALYFSDIGGTLSNGRIQKYTPADGKIVVFADQVGIGGLAVDPQGMLVAAAHDQQRLSRFDPASGQRTDVPGGSMYLGKPFNQCNDVVVRSDGNMYFSDPSYQLAGRPGQGVNAFYRLSPQGIATRIVTAMNANGVALSPDGLWLYLSTTGGPPLQRFALDQQGAVVGAGTTLINGSSDGMAVDCAGNLYLSGGGQVKVFSPAGQQLGSVGGLTSGFVTNSAFGGEDHKTLYVTNSTALYEIALNLPGFPD
jgi:gluconolactonase